MKIILALILEFLFIACSAQDTLVYYTKEYIDTNYYPISYCDSLIQIALTTSDSVYQNPSLFGNTQITINDSIGTKTTLKKENSDYWFEIKEGVKRYKFWIIEENLEIWIGDSSRASLILQYPLEN